MSDQGELNMENIEETKKESMRITELHVENIKKIKVVDVTPKEDLVIIEGRNAQGKTSLMDSICYLLGGAKLIPEEPLAHGKTDGIIEAVVGDFKITRKWSIPEKSALKIESKEGFSPKSPQTFLDSLIGNIAFDPLEFVRMDWEKQVRVVKEITGLETEDLENEYNKQYDLRKIAKRDLDRTEKGLLGYRDLPPLSEITNRKELQEKLNKIYEQNRTIDQARELIASIEKTDRELEQAIVNYEKQIKINRERIEANKKEIETLKEKSEMKKEDPDSLKAQLDESDKLVEIEFKHKRKDELNKEKDRSKNELEKIQKKMDGLKSEKEERVKAAKMPIEGLDVTGKGVYYNKVQINETSLAEQIKISMALAMLQNPKVRIILIKDGSLLDNDSMDQIKEMAKKNDFQVWLEKISNEKGNELYIEDGEIK